MNATTDSPVSLDEMRAESEGAAGSIILKYGMPRDLESLQNMLAMAYCDGAAFAITRSFPRIIEAFMKSVSGK